MPFLEFHALLLFPPLTDSKALLHWLLQAPKTLLWKCYHTALPDVLTASTWAALTQAPPSTRTFPRAAKRTRCFPACAQHAKGNESCSSQLHSTVEWLLNEKVTDTPTGTACEESKLHQTAQDVCLPFPPATCTSWPKNLSSDPLDKRENKAENYYATYIKSWTPEHKELLLLLGAQPGHQCHRASAR